MGSEKKLALDLPWRSVQPNTQHEHIFNAFAVRQNNDYDILLK
jgi:uncharacterized protein (DUF2249 family)